MAKRKKSPPKPVAPLQGLISMFELRRPGTPIYADHGALGRVNRTQLKAHERAQKMTHEWTKGRSNIVGKEKVRSTVVEQTCRICGKVRRKHFIRPSSKRCKG